MVENTPRRREPSIEGGEIVRPISVSALAEFLGGMDHVTLMKAVNGDPDLREINFISRFDRRIGVEDAKRIAEALKPRVQ